jgi:hypothetical protein
LIPGLAPAWSRTADREALSQIFSGPDKLYAAALDAILTGKFGKK